MSNPRFSPEFKDEAVRQAIDEGDEPIVWREKIETYVRSRSRENVGR